jgi:hypothetical protein
MSPFLACLTTLAIGLAPGELQEPERPGRGQERPAPKKEEPQDYATVVKDLEKKEGLFRVFTKGETILFEIPKNLMGRDLYWYSELRLAPRGSFSGSGANGNVVRWEERGDKVLLRTVDYSTRARDGGGALISVLQSNFHPIAAALDVKARGEGGAPVVDVTKLYKTEIPEFGARNAIGRGTLDADRTFVERVAVFPENVNVQVLVTYKDSPGGAAAPSFFGRGASGPSISAVIHHGLVLLPEEPMQGRLADSRVGYFTTNFTDYGISEYHGSKPYEYITRYRLEKKDPKAALSEPVKPIVYYIPKEIPEKWREYARKGVEDWQPAFEKAGFKNAIIAKDAPDDPDWSPEDVRYSVIRWVSLPVRNAFGPHVHDPRSGEILSAHVVMYHDALKLVADWYFAQASAADPRAQKLPFPDDLMGECIRFVVAHEVGHTIGLHHNGKSSAMVPVQWLRDSKWTHENGTAASIMDYARFNYVAQPGDNANLQPKVGAYDKWAIWWGYCPIPEAKTAWDEVKVTDVWAAEQVQNPLVRFHNNYNSADPTALSETLGDDAVAASTLGTANLKRTMGFLIPATTKLGEDYSELSRYHGTVVSQFNNFLSHVMAVVGGVELIDYRAGRGGETYVPTSREDQIKSVRWLCDNALKTPLWLVPAEVTYRLGSDAGMARMNSVFSRVINGLFSDSRLDRMRTNAIKLGRAAYTVEEMADTVRAEVWSELAANAPAVDPYRMGLHRAYVSAMISNLSPGDPVRGLARSELASSLGLVRGALPKVRDRASKAHLEDMADLMHLALTDHTKVLPPPSAGPAEVPRGRREACPIWCREPEEHEHLPGCSFGGIQRG